MTIVVGIVVVVTVVGMVVVIMVVGGAMVVVVMIVGDGVGAKYQAAEADAAAITMTATIIAARILVTALLEIREPFNLIPPL